MTTALFVFTHERRELSLIFATTQYGLRVYTIVNVKEPVYEIPRYSQKREALVVRETAEMRQKV